MKNTPNWKDYYTDKKVINIANRLTTKLLQLNIKSRKLKIWHHSKLLLPFP